MGNKFEVIYSSNGKPYGVRNDGGYVFLLPNITKFVGQEERYVRELKEQEQLACYLCQSLNCGLLPTIEQLETENAQLKAEIERLKGLLSPKQNPSHSYTEGMDCNNG